MTRSQIRPANTPRPIHSVTRTASRTGMSIAILLVMAAGAAVRPGPSEAARSSGHRAPAEPSDRCSLVGRVIDKSGAPVAGVRIELFGGLATRFKGQSAVTDADGRYRFDPLETGAGRPGMLNPGMRLSHPQFVAADGKDWWDVEVPCGQDVVKDFAMVRGGSVKGELRFGEGGWILRAFDLRLISSDGQRTAYATTDNRGEFVTEALFPGEYEVQWNEPIASYAPITSVTVGAGSQTSFGATIRVSMQAEVRAETPRTAGD